MHPGWRRKARHDAAAERCRRYVLGNVGAEHPTELLQTTEIGCEVRLCRQPGFKAPGRNRIELTVEIGVQKHVALLALVDHGTALSISMRRARARRDMTVPMGMSSMAAISL